MPFHLVLRQGVQVDLAADLHLTLERLPCAWQEPRMLSLSPHHWPELAITGRSTIKYETFFLLTAPGRKERKKESLLE